ncbi:hypothetical protein GGI43DRAFT_422769 [Trichoderma evansii]
MSDPKKYTVGWICSQSMEQIAAAEFLDAEHERLENQSPNDPNNYILGSIKEHNVVIAVLPQEQGIASAANVATNLLRNFPNIKVGLLVGVGGGAPSKKHDIRLGDVVEGAFQYTGHLNKPPTILRSTAETLLTNHTRRGHQFKEDIDGILEKNKRLINKFGRPEASSDMLFLSTIVHKEGECAAECAKDKPNLVSRRKRTEYENDPEIHYGLIASANRVMKDAILRDKLSAEKDVLCFEMEAAGLMNNFPCLVIRGICDYSDSHKNDKWKGFAAMAAAAYAKDLLGLIQPSRVEVEPRLGEVLIEVAENVANINTNVEDIRSHIISQQDLKILNWLADSDYSSQKNDYFNRHQEGTGQWLLDSAVYQGWLSKSKQNLICPGIPGAGKTILTAIVIENLRSRFSNDPKVGVAYNFYNFNRQAQQTANKFMASLLRQLCPPEFPLPEAVKSLHDNHSRENTRPSLEEILRALKAVVKTFSREEADINIFATSRPNLEIEKEFQRCTLVDIVASRDDICKYIDGYMSTHPRYVHKSTDLKERIKTEIANTAEGMFLLAQLYLGVLEDKVSVASIKDALEKFQRLREMRGEDKKLEILKGNQKGFHRLAENALSWLCHAKRRFTTIELQHAPVVDMELDHDKIPQIFDDDSILELDLIVSSCLGLVTVDKESNAIRLVHYTTQEYFDRMRKKFFPEAETKIANVCTLYLTFDIFESGTFDDSLIYPGENQVFWNSLQLNPFYGYACMNWVYHANETNYSSQIIRDFLTNEEKVEIAGQAIYAMKAAEDIEWMPPMLMTSLDLAGFFGAVNLIKKLPSILNIPLRPVGLYYALCGALWNRQTDAAQWLLEKGADLSMDDGYFQTPLLLAVANDDVDAVQLLLHHGADPDNGDNSNWTPLAKAASGDNIAIVQLLLEKGADFTIKDQFQHMTAVEYAVDNYNEDMIRLVFEKATCTYPKQKVYCLKNLLLNALVSYGYMELIEKIFEKDLWPKVKGRFGSKLLYFAISRGHKDVAELLLQKGAKLMQKGWYGAFGLTGYEKADREWLAQKFPLLFTKYA